MMHLACLTVTNTLIAARISLFLLSCIAIYSWLRTPRSRTASERFMSFTWILTAIGIFLFQPQMLFRLYFAPVDGWHLVIIRAQDLIAAIIFGAAMLSIIAGLSLRRGVGEQRARAWIAGQIFMCLTVDAGVWAVR